MVILKRWIGKMGTGFLEALEPPYRGVKKLMRPDVREELRTFRIEKQKREPSEPPFRGVATPLQLKPPEAQEIQGIGVPAGIRMKSIMTKRTAM